MAIFIFWIGLALLVGVIGKDRKIGFGFAFFWAVLLSPIIGLVIVLLSDKPTTKSHKYKVHLESAKKFEFRGDIDSAINSYMDTLYHLENDYKDKRLDKAGEVKRQTLITEMNLKVRELKIGKE